MAGAGPYQGPVTGSLVNFFALDRSAPRRRRQSGSGRRRRQLHDRQDHADLHPEQLLADDDQRRRCRPQSAELKVTPQPNCPVRAGICAGSRTAWTSSSSTRPATSTRSRSRTSRTRPAHLQHRGQDLNYAVRRRRFGHADREQHVLPESRDESVDEVQRRTLDVAAGRQRRGPQVRVLRRPESADAAEAAGRRGQLPLRRGRQLHRAARADRRPTGRSSRSPPANPDRWPVSAAAATTSSTSICCGSARCSVTIRMQAAMPACAAPTRPCFRNPGTAVGGDRYVPDYQMQFEVTPRNLNLTR